MNLCIETAQVVFAHIYHENVLESAVVGWTETVIVLDRFSLTCQGQMFDVKI